MTKPVCADSCGTMPDCVPLAVPYVPYQQMEPKRYEPAEALANGTLFPGLDLPFHLKRNAPKAMKGPLGELQALEFVLVELGLYLDTHDCDEEAYAVFKQYAALEKVGRQKYEAMYGPLTMFAAADAKSYSCWVRDPWPWDYPEGGDK